MVPRPRINGELAHRHIVTCSSSTSTGAAPLYISSTLGNPLFQSGGSASPNMSMSWSLAEMVIALGGLPAISIPLPNVAELQQLYDTFQIEKVEVTLFFGATQSLISGDAQLGIQWVMPLLGYAPDSDDAANTSITQLQQYSTYKCTQVSSPLKINIVPCSAGATFDPTSGTVPAQLGFTRLQRQDINVAYAGTPHYGLKFAVDTLRAQPAGAPGGALTYVSVQSRVHLLMKATR